MIFLRLRNKIIHYSIYLLLAAIHLFFIIKVIWNQQYPWEITALLLAVVITMVLAYKRFFSHHKESPTGNYKEILAVLIGAVATFYLAQFSAMNAVLASCTVGVLVSFVPSIFPKIEDIKDFPAAVYCGSFVGMSSDLILDNIWLLVNAGLVSGFLFAYSKNTLPGFGGKLGTIAFVGVLMVITIYSLIA